MTIKQNYQGIIMLMSHDEGMEECDLDPYFLRKAGDLDLQLKLKSIH